MTASKHGKTSWDEPVNDPSKRSNGNFLRLAKGSNVIRILTLPHLYNQHRYEPDGGKKFGYRINCSRSETEKDCPLCEIGNKAKKRWLVSALVKNTGEVKTLDIGYSVFKSLQNLAKGEWGPPDTYDIDIQVDPEGGATNYYFVSPCPPKPLSAEDIAKKEEANASDDLSARTEPPTPAKVKERLDKIREEIENGGAPMSGGSKGSEKSEKTESVEEEDDGDDFFKNYNKQKAS